MVVDILRTQFIAILGNISVAMPVALLIALAWGYFYDTPMIDGAQAAHLLHDLDPIRSLALPHAAIAGVFLFVSGLVAGYYDNLAAYNKIGERIRKHWVLMRVMPKRWLDKMSSFVEANLGAIMGNFIFWLFFWAVQQRLAICLGYLWISVILLFCFCQLCAWAILSIA